MRPAISTGSHIRRVPNVLIVYSDGSAKLFTIKMYYIVETFMLSELLLSELLLSELLLSELLLSELLLSELLLSELLLSELWRASRRIVYISVILIIYLESVATEHKQVQSILKQKAICSFRLSLSSTQNSQSGDSVTVR